MAKYVGISRFSMRRAIKDEIHLTPYIKQSGQVISETSKQKSLFNSKLIMELEPATGKIFIWSSKKKYTVEAVINKQ